MLSDDALSSSMTYVSFFLASQYLRDDNDAAKVLLNVRAETCIARMYTSVLLGNNLRFS